MSTVEHFLLHICLGLKLVIRYSILRCHYKLARDLKYNDGNVEKG